MSLNKKGYTLIEIMVTLVISSIILVVAGSIILNSFGYFDKTEKANMDKLAVDKVAELVHGELAYASKVVIAKEKPSIDDWYSLSIDEDGYLLKTSYVGKDKTSALLYNQDFYNQRTLIIKARVYKNDYRMDLNYSFLDKDDEVVYKTNNTLELINMKSPSLTGTNTKSDLLDITHKSGYEIFYQKGAYGFTNDIEFDPDGTVNDEFLCMGDSNSFTWTNGDKYRKGDFVKYGVYWYRAISNVNSTEQPDENKNGSWKLIASYWSSMSSYLKGDVIQWPKSSGIYYQCILDYAYKDDIHAEPGKDSGFYWKRLTKEQYDQIKEQHKESSFCTVEEDKFTGTVADQIKCYDKKYDKTEELNKLPDYEVGTYIAGEFVLIKTGDEEVLYRCMKSGSFSKNEIVSNNSLCWKKISAFHEPQNAYIVGDIVVDEKTGDYYICKKNTINEGREIDLGDYEGFWQKLDEAPNRANDNCSIPTS